MAQGAFFQAADSGFFGAASIFCQSGGSAGLIRVTMDSIVPVTFNVLNPHANGAAVVATANASLSIIDTLIQNTTNATSPGDAVLINDNSIGVLENVSGSGNAGVGVRILASSQLSNAVHNSGNVVTGTGGDVFFGATGVITWGTAGTGTQQTDTTQLCLIKNGN
jgi:hypothetical protein